MEDMIEDLHHLARRQGSGCHPIQSPTLDCSTILDVARTPLCDGANFSLLWSSMEIMNLQTSYGWSNTSIDVRTNTILQCAWNLGEYSSCGMWPRGMPCKWMLAMWHTHVGHQKTYKLSLSTLNEPS
jgi:hypothetical protein